MCMQCKTKGMGDEHVRSSFKIRSAKRSKTQKGIESKRCSLVVVLTSRIVQIPLDYPALEPTVFLNHRPVCLPTATIPFITHPSAPSFQTRQLIFHTLP